MDEANGVEGGDALEVVREADAEGEKVAFGGGDFLAGNDKEAVDGEAVGGEKAVFLEVIDAGAGVVVGDGEAVEALAAGFLDQGLGLRDAIGGEARVAVEIEEELHGALLPHAKPAGAESKVSSGGGGDKWETEAGIFAKSDLGCCVHRFAGRTELILRQAQEDGASI
jgi:hypothetical protein